MNPDELDDLLADSLVDALRAGPQPLAFGNLFSLALRVDSRQRTRLAHRDVSPEGKAELEARLVAHEWRDARLDCPAWSAVVASRLGLPPDQAAHQAQAWWRDALIRASTAPWRAAALGTFALLHVRSYPGMTGRNPATGAPVPVRGRTMLFVASSRRVRALLDRRPPPARWDPDAGELATSPLPPPRPLPSMVGWPAGLRARLASLAFAKAIEWIDRARLGAESIDWLADHPLLRSHEPIACEREAGELATVYLLDAAWRVQPDPLVYAIGKNAFDGAPLSAVAYALGRLQAWDLAAGRRMMSPRAVEQALAITHGWAGVPEGLRGPLPF